MDASRRTHTHLLGRYTVDGQERHVLAHLTDDIEVEEIVDVLARPVDGDDDSRRVEGRIICLGESQAIADDYIKLADDLGGPPMPSTWW